MGVKRDEQADAIQNTPFCSWRPYHGAPPCKQTKTASKGGTPWQGPSFNWGPHARPRSFCALRCRIFGKGLDNTAQLCYTHGDEWREDDINILSQTPCRESMQLRSSPTASLRRARLNSPDHESGLFFCSLAARRSPGDRGRGGCDRVPAGRRQAADRRTLPMGLPQQYPLLDI